jgi:hypothetical protein
MIIPNIWKNEKCSKPPTRIDYMIMMWNKRIKSMDKEIDSGYDDQIM